MVGAAPYSRRWGYVRIITGTILGGILGFYVMHRLEVSYKEKMKERLRIYEMEVMRKDEQQKRQDCKNVVPRPNWRLPAEVEKRITRGLTIWIPFWSELTSKLI